MIEAAVVSERKHVHWAPSRPLPDVPLLQQMRQQGLSVDAERQRGLREQDRAFWADHKTAFAHFLAGEERGDEPVIGQIEVSNEELSPNYDFEDIDPKLLDSFAAQQTPLYQNATHADSNDSTPPQGPPVDSSTVVERSPESKNDPRRFPFPPVPLRQQMREAGYLPIEHLSLHTANERSEALFADGEGWVACFRAKEDELEEAKRLEFIRRQ